MRLTLTFALTLALTTGMAAAQTHDGHVDMPTAAAGA